MAEVERLLGQLAAAGVPLDQNGADVAPLAAVQAALRRAEGSGQQAAAASIQSNEASTLGEGLQGLLARLRALVAQLREQNTS